MTVHEPVGSFYTVKCLRRAILFVGDKQYVNVNPGDSLEYLGNDQFKLNNEVAIRFHPAVYFIIANEHDFLTKRGLQPLVMYKLNDLYGD